MRTLPEQITLPNVGLRKPENRLSSVVFPHPEGPTTATNSPLDISKERRRNTSTEPKLTEAPSIRNGLSFISPSDAANLCEPYQDAIDHHADYTDNDHSGDQEIHSQTVASVPDCKTQSIAPGDHFGRHHDQPGETGCDSQRCDDLWR